MKSYEDFLKSLEQPTAPEMSYLLKALWEDKKGNWDRSHDLVDGPDGNDAARIHAYLHRKEGDIWNADYWYRRSGETRPNILLDEEWEMLVRRYLEIT